MPSYLLDSDAVIDLLNHFPPTIALLRQLELDGHTLCSCDVVAAEVYSGLSDDGDQSAHIFLSATNFLVLSREGSQQAGRWRYAYRRQGRSLSTYDALVAATAVEHQATLVTGNLRHFPMPELSLLPLPR